MGPCPAESANGPMEKMSHLWSKVMVKFGAIPSIPSVSNNMFEELARLHPGIQLPLNNASFDILGPRKITRSLGNSSSPGSVD